MSDLPAHIELCTRNRDGQPCLGVLFRPTPEVIYCRACGGNEPGVLYVRKDGDAALSVEPQALGYADKRVVFDLLEDLRAAWEKILNDYATTHRLQTERGGVRYIDGWMACHNFFKLALDHLASEADLTGEAAAQLFLAAGETFQMAMRARAEEARTGRLGPMSTPGPPPLTPDAPQERNL